MATLTHRDLKETDESVDDLRFYLVHNGQVVHIHPDPLGSNLWKMTVDGKANGLFETTQDALNAIV